MSSLVPPSNVPAGAFTVEQKEYLAGFMAGIGATGAVPFAGQTATARLTATPHTATDGVTSPPNLVAEQTFHGTPLSDLCKEERWKYDENPLDAWERLLGHANGDKPPDGENTYRFKYFGLFYVAPAQDSFMLRLRVPACELSASQLHALADLARDLGGGYAHITTRGNLQIREFKPRDIINVLMRVEEMGLTSRCSGADNIRNITASPDSGFARDEILDVRPFAKALHHYLINHRELSGLPRKFNVAFDNGGSMSVAADTNDIGFVAVRVTPSSELQTPNSKLRTPNIAPGIYFRVQLGGITGHRDFAKDTGLLVTPAQAVAVAVAMVRVFSENGNRTDRKKARLKYLLDSWGQEKFLAETEKRLAFPLTYAALALCEQRRPVEKHAWLGARRQAQSGLNSLGIGVPVGRLSSRQMHALADLATHYGKGELRLTVWQNVIIPHLPDAFLETVRRNVQRLGFFTEASSAAGGIVACTGNQGCKYAAADTKGHAASLFKHLESRVAIGMPVNLHFTGCAHSCAQHYCGDLGFIAAKLSDGSEGYHIVIGGGMDHEQGTGRELFKGIRATELNPLVEKILLTYEAKKSSGETFVQWSRRHSLKDLQEILS